MDLWTRFVNWIAPKYEPTALQPYPHYTYTTITVPDDKPKRPYHHDVSKINLAGTYRNMKVGEVQHFRTDKPSYLSVLAANLKKKGVGSYSVNKTGDRTFKVTRKS